MAKKKTKTEKILSSVGRELKRDEPAIVGKARIKHGERAARKQETAILLSKARRRGARIKKK